MLHLKTVRRFICSPPRGDAGGFFMQKEKLDNDNVRSRIWFHHESYYHRHHHHHRHHCRSVLRCLSSQLSLFRATMHGYIPIHLSWLFFCDRFPFKVFVNPKWFENWILVTMVTYMNTEVGWKQRKIHFQVMLVVINFCAIGTLDNDNITSRVWFHHQSSSSSLSSSSSSSPSSSPSSVRSISKQPSLFRTAAVCNIPIHPSCPFCDSLPFDYNNIVVSYVGNHFNLELVCTMEFFLKAEIARASSASAIWALWKTHKCKLITDWTKKTVWLHINNINMKKFTWRTCRKNFLEAIFAYYIDDLRQALFSRKTT